MDAFFAVLSIFLTIFIFGFLVFVHELGHFLAARFNGVQVEEFAFGFGPKIWGKKIGHTEYKINLIPLGGYVLMFGDEDPSSFKQDRSLINDPRSYISKGFWQKVSIMLAGVFINFIVAIVIFYIYLAGTNFRSDPLVSIVDYNFIGAEQNEYMFYVAQDFDSNIYESDLPYASFLYSINDQRITNKEDLQRIVNENTGLEITVKTINQNYEIKESAFKLEEKGSGGNAYLGIYPLSSKLSILEQQNPEALIYNGISEDGLAYSSEFPKLGAIISVNETKISNREELENILNQNENQKVSVEVVDFESNSNTYEVQLGEKYEGDGNVKLGIYVLEPFDYPDTYYFVDYNNYKLTSGISHTINITFYQAMALAELANQAFSGESLLLIESVATPIKVGEAVYTEVTIADDTTDTVQDAIASLVPRLVKLTGLLSATLAFMNLLPIPLIDGGQLMFLIIEKLRGKPLSEKMQERIGGISFGCLTLLAIVLLLKDFFMVIIDRII
jgi:regulator of sigma E protease